MAKFDSDWIPSSAMTIFAHPDDMEFSCGATLAKWAKAGCDITVVLCTSGNVGTHDAKFTPYTLAAVREVEQKNACAVLGIKHIEFLRHDDSRLVADLTLRRELVHLIRKHKPEVVFCGDPNLVFWGPQSHQPSRSSRGGAGRDRCDLSLRLDGTAVARRRPSARSAGRLRARLRTSGYVDRRERHDRVEDQGAARASLPARWITRTWKR